MSTDTRDESEGSDPVIRWVDLLFLIFRWRKKIGISVLLVMIVTACISLLLPKWYKSTAVVVLPDKTGTLLDALSSSGTSDLTNIGASLLGGGSTNSVSRYLAIMNSRRLREDIIHRFGLMDVYHVEEMDDALEILEDGLVVEADKKLGTVSITCYFFDDPEKTAEIANYAVSKLDEVNRELVTEQARTTRQFIEERYDQSRKDLKASEDSLNLFQKTFDIVSIPDQIKAGIEAAAEIQSQMVTTEIEYNVKKKTLGNNHPELLRLESQLAEFRKTQRRMDVGGADLGVFIPF